jgi:hypothetical protein
VNANLQYIVGCSTGGRPISIEEQPSFRWYKAVFAAATICGCRHVASM